MRKELILKTSRRLFVEIPGFYIGISLLEWGFYNSIQAWISQSPVQFPHPYWIGILLFGLLYGITEGLVAAVLSSILVLWLSPLNFTWNPLEWSQVSSLPLFFILAGLLLGFIGQQVKLKIDSSSLTVQKLENQLSELHKTTNQLNRSNLNLEKKIVFRLETFQTVYEIATSLNKLHLDQLYKTIPQLVGKYFKANQCSFFLVETSESLVLKSTYGWQTTDSYHDEYKSDSDLFRYLNDCEETTIIPGDVLQSLNIDAVFAVSLITEEKMLLGMIKIERMQFMNITKDNLRFLSLLSKWFVQSILNGLRYAQREKESTFDPRTGLVREDTFWFIVKKIVAAAVRHKYDTVLLNLSLNFPKHVGTVEKNLLINNIGDILKQVCRIDDEVGIADFNRSYSFMIMMPHTNIEKAKIVTEKAAKAIFEQLSDSYTFMRESDFLSWEYLSLEDGTLFLSETVQQMVFDPILTGKP